MSSALKKKGGGAAVPGAAAPYVAMATAGGEDVGTAARPVRVGRTRAGKTRSGLMCRLGEKKKRKKKKKDIK